MRQVTLVRFVEQVFGLEGDLRTFIGTCECCQLPQRLAWAASDENGRAPVDQCEVCRGHQGETLGARAQRAEEHLPMHHEREAAARAAAEDYKERMHAAFRSREHSVRLLRRLRDLHEPHGQGCSCGIKRDCKSLDLVEASWVREQVAQLNRREAEDRVADPYWDDEHEIAQYSNPRSFEDAVG